MRFSLVASITILPLVVSGQDTSPTQDVPTTTEALGTTITPPASDPFPTLGTVQLVDAVLEPLSDTLKEFFGFDDIIVTETTRKARSVHNRATTGTECKTFPGDKLWPSETWWNQLDVFVGGALTKTTPLAAPCYSGAHYVSLNLSVFNYSTFY